MGKNRNKWRRGKGGRRRHDPDHLSHEHDETAVADQLKGGNKPTKPAPLPVVQTLRCSYCVFEGNEPGKCPDCCKDQIGFRYEPFGMGEKKVHCHCNQPGREVGKCWACKGLANVPIRKQRGNPDLSEVYEEKPQAGEPSKA